MRDRVRLAVELGAIDPDDAPPWALMPPRALRTEDIERRLGQLHKLPHSEDRSIRIAQLEAQLRRLRADGH